MDAVETEDWAEEFPLEEVILLRYALNHDWELEITILEARLSHCKVEVPVADVGAAHSDSFVDLVSQLL